MFPLLTLKMVVRLVSAQHGRLRQGQLVEFLFLNHMSGHDALTKITISCYSHFKSWIKKIFKKFVGFVPVLQVSYYTHCTVFLKYSNNKQNAVLKYSNNKQNTVLK